MVTEDKRRKSKFEVPFELKGEGDRQWIDVGTISFEIGVLADGETEPPCIPPPPCRPKWDVKNLHTIVGVTVTMQPPSDATRNTVPIVITAEKLPIR